MTIETIAMVSSTAITCSAVGTAYLVRVHGGSISSTKCHKMSDAMRGSPPPKIESR